MAGDQQPITSNEYGNKLLNGEGLLHLVGTIKTEISNAGGGGATYTAGRGIKIDEGNIISTTNKGTDALGIGYLFEGLFNNGIGPHDYYVITTTTKEDFIKYLKAGLIVKYKGNDTISILGEDIVVNPGGGGLLPNCFYVGGLTNSDSMNFNRYFGSSTWNVSSNSDLIYILSGNTVFRTTDKSYVLSLYRLIRFLKNSKNTWMTSTTMNAAINEVAEKISSKQDVLTAGTGIDITNGVISATNSGENSSLPADPENDGTYFLITTVSSGTATQTWTSISNANGNNF